jgi:hypothetical protein
MPTQPGQAWGVSLYKKGNDTVFKGAEVNNWAVTNQVANVRFPSGFLYNVLNGLPVPGQESDATQVLGRASLNLVYQGGTPAFRIESVGTTITGTGETHVMWGSCWSSVQPG